MCLLEINKLYVYHNFAGYGEVIKRAAKNLESDGCLLDVYCGSFCNNQSQVEKLPTKPLSLAIMTIKMAMMKFSHGLHRGRVYKKAEKGQFT